MTDFGSKKQICAGRLLLDIPQDSQVKLKATYHSNEVNKSNYANDFSAIENDIKKRADILKNEKMKKDEDSVFWEKGGIGLDKVMAPTRLLGMDFNRDALLATIGYHENNSNIGIEIEGHKLLANNYHYVLIRKNSGADKYGLALSSLVEAANRLRSLRPKEIPKFPGFCFDGGIFVDQGRPEANEIFTLVIEFPDHPEVHFSIESIAIDEADDEEPLERRVDRDLALMRENAGEVHVLRRGKREAAGQHGYEIDISAPSDTVAGAKLQKFFWGADGVPNDVSRPFLEVDMMIQPTEKTGNSFANEGEAQAFWEQLLASLRIRPGAV